MARGTTNAIKLVAIDPLNVIAMRKLTSVTVIVKIPIKSIRCFLGISLSLSRNIFWSFVNMKIVLMYLPTFIDVNEPPAYK